MFHTGRHEYVTTRTAIVTGRAVAGATLPELSLIAKAFAPRLLEVFRPPIEEISTVKAECLTDYSVAIRLIAMARPRSEDKRTAIMTAATRVIVSRGLSAPTATIALEAGVANGTLFTYFATKADLFNQLYLELKSEMVSVALANFPGRRKLRDQMFHVWSHWMTWAVSNPEKRRAFQQLEVSEEITAATRRAGHKTMAEIGKLLERCRAAGPMRDAPMAFVASLMNSMAEATMDFMVHDSTNAAKHCKDGFSAFWRVIA